MYRLFAYMCPKNDPNVGRLFQTWSIWVCSLFGLALFKGLEKFYGIYGQLSMHNLHVITHGLRQHIERYHRAMKAPQTEADNQMDELVRHFCQAVEKDDCATLLEQPAVLEWGRGA